MSIRTVGASPTTSNAGLYEKTLFDFIPRSPWVRNPSWPACTANIGDNRVRGLYAVYPGGGNFIAMNISGNYTVNFGDGTINNYTSGISNYEYNYNSALLVGTEAPVTFTDVSDSVNRAEHGYSNGMQVRFFNITTTTGIVNDQYYFVINATTNTFQVSATLNGPPIVLTNDGTGQLLPYRVATVTITPQAGSNLTTINFQTKHNQAGLANGYASGWLDLAIASPTITGISIFSNSFVRNTNIESVQINQTGNILSFSSLFNGLNSLQNVVISPTITTVTNTNFMFSSCYSIQTVPLFNTAAVTSMQSMFSGCYSLKSVPPFNAPLVTNMSNMFNTCYSLESVPLFNTAAVGNTASMFSNCYALKSVPLFNTAAVTSMSSMFNACYSLKSVPLFNTASVTNMSQMFSNCYPLESVPLFNTAAVTNMFGMFTSCASLRTVPLFNTANVTNMDSVFVGCTSLQTVPLFNTANVTNMAGMFSNCNALLSVPPFNTAAVTSMIAMFNNCFSLLSIPLFNTVSVTNMTQMFALCSSLGSIPALVTTAVISGGFDNMFLSCPSIARIEAKNFRFSFSVSGCKLSATALNEIYTNLPTVTSQTITVTSNYGTATDNPAIATAKGWTVTG